MSYVGERWPRKEDGRLLTGGGQYVGDIVLPRMAHASFVRSPHAHARIRGIDTEPARLVEGVECVLTHTDLGSANRNLPIIPPHPALEGRNGRLLASDRVRFVGEAVAIVVAASKAAADEARDRVEVDYEPLPSAQVLVAQPAPPRVHDDIADNRAGRVTLLKGDVETALRESPRRFAQRLVIGRGGGQPIEPRGIVADFNAMAGQLTVWAASQVSHQIRQFVCDFLGLSAHQVRLIAPDVGGGFGAKLIVYPEDVLLPLVSHRLKRPVRWIEERAEHMLTATQEREQVHEVEVGFDEQGRLLALKDHFLHDNGAYTPRGLVVPLLTASMMSGPYRIPALSTTLESVYTHRVPVTPYRGAGQPQAVFVIERVLDRIALETGLDRAAVRMINLVRPADMPYDVGVTNYRSGGSVVYDSGDYPGVLQRVLALADHEALVARQLTARASGEALGIGLACHVELTGVGPFEGATVRADAGGNITVFTGVTAQGQGLETTLAQIAASDFGVKPDEVAVVAGDTQGIEQGVGTFASRAAVTGGSAVRLAARDLRVKARKLAAWMLDVPQDDVEQDGKAFYRRGRSNYRIGLGELARAAAYASVEQGIEPGLEVTRYFQPADITYSSGAHVALVKVDRETGRVQVLGYWVCHDCGPAINPTVVEGQLHGAIALGISSALLESVHYDDRGQQLAGSFMDYAMPRAVDIPAFVLDHIETPSPHNPLGLKGVGESGTLPVPAVLASAIEDALGAERVEVCQMPLTLPALARLLALDGGL